MTKALACDQYCKFREKVGMTELHQVGVGYHPCFFTFNAKLQYFPYTCVV